MRMLDFSIQKSVFRLRLRRVYRDIVCISYLNRTDRDHSGAVSYPHEWVRVAIAHAYRVVQPQPLRKHVLPAERHPSECDNDCNPCGVAVAPVARGQVPADGSVRGAE